MTFIEMDNFQSLLAMSETYGKHLKKVSQPFLDAFGASQLCLDRTYKNGNYWALNTDNELWQYYLGNGGLLMDPNVKSPIALNDGIFIWNVCATGDYAEILKAFNQIFGLKQGISIVKLLSDKSNIGVSFGCKTTELEFIPRLLRESHLVRNFLNYLQKELADIIRELEKNSFKLLQYKKEDWHANHEKSLKLSSYQRESLLLLMGNISKNDLKMKELTLTQRQSQCAALYLRGLSVKNIANRMGISYDVVKEYFQLIKKKLQVNNKSELLQKLKILKELELLPSEYINL